MLSELSREGYLFRQGSLIKQQFEKHQVLEEQVDELKHLIGGIDDMSILKNMVTSGEITASEYYFEAEGYINAQLGLLELERELMLLRSELLRQDL